MTPQNHGARPLPPTGGAAFFVTSHGFGHAARAAAVMASLHKLVPDIHFQVFTNAPKWIFEESMQGGFTCHHQPVDIGLVQHHPMKTDVAATVAALERFVPFSSKTVDSLAQRLDHTNCRMILCDIAPLGIAVAERLGIPSVLIENFTWDWLYEGYAHVDSRFLPLIAHLRQWFEAADLHIQAEPVCAPNSFLPQVPPVSRSPGKSRQEIRKELGISPSDTLALITMGGIAGSFEFLDRLPERSGLYFLIPGIQGGGVGQGNVIHLPKRSGFYHPDLMAAADLVIGKAGYSTVAEAFHAGVPFLYILRPAFRESSVLAEFIEREMTGLPLVVSDLCSDRWWDRVEPLLKPATQRPRRENGADVVARHLLSYV